MITPETPVIVSLTSRMPYYYTQFRNGLSTLEEAYNNLVESYETDQPCLIHEEYPHITKWYHEHPHVVLIFIKQPIFRKMFMDELHYENCHEYACNSLFLFHEKYGVLVRTDVPREIPIKYACMLAVYVGDCIGVEVYELPDADAGVYLGVNMDAYFQICLQEIKDFIKLNTPESYIVSVDNIRKNLEYVSFMYQYDARADERLYEMAKLVTMMMQDEFNAVEEGSFI